MNSIAARAICLLMGYVCGNFVTGYFVGKANKVDLTKEGSGNIGATNTVRTLGMKAGLVTFLGDILKTIIPAVLSWVIFHDKYDGLNHILMFYGAFGAVIGHNFPAVMKFKGGKGIACTAGLIISVTPILIPIELALFVGCFLLTKYVSVSSIVILLAFVAESVIFSKCGILYGFGEGVQMELYILAILVAILGIVRHHANIKRLIEGTENKFDLSKKKKENK